MRTYVSAGAWMHASIMPYFRLLWKLQLIGCSASVHRSNFFCIDLRYIFIRFFLNDFLLKTKTTLKLVKNTHLSDFFGFDLELK